MNGLLTTAGLLFIVVSAILLVVSFLFTKEDRPRTLRTLSGFRRLRRSLGLSVEQGTRMHVSLGSASIIEPNSASALVGLASLTRVSEISSISDRPPLATSGSGGLALLSKDSMQAGYQSANAAEQYNPDQAFLSGPTPLSYIAGTIPLLRPDHISSNILVGNFGPEVALLVQTTNQQDAFTLAGSDSLPAQAVLFASAQEPLIGEELFALPAYLQAGRIYEGSILAQDIIRWILILGLLAGSALTYLGIL